MTTTMINKAFAPMLALMALSFFAGAQAFKIDPGVGFEMLKVGDSFEKVQSTVGFGKLKTYKQYIAEELFDRSPEQAVECMLGFDHYLKFEHLIPIPVFHIFFKDDKVCQILVSSFPDYYRPLSEDVVIKENLRFWDDRKKLKSVMGTANFINEDEYLILESHLYLDYGVTFNFRDNALRTVHVFKVPDPAVGNSIISKLSQ